MKTRFTTLDIAAVLTELNLDLVGMRLANVYDINNKTYLLKLAKPDKKVMLLMESGIRLHKSEFDWPKNMMPSGFSMKLRKHLRGRRFVTATQLGIDRIVDMQFGSDEAAYHIILELYDRGNIILTDYQYTILNILRFRKDKSTKETSSQGDQTKEDNTDVRFAVQETYPLYAAKQRQDLGEIKSQLTEVIKNAKPDQVLKRLLNPHLPYGAQCIEHCLLLAGFPSDVKINQAFVDGTKVEQLFSGLSEGERLLDSAKLEPSQGYIIQKVEKKSDGTTLNTNTEFHPFLFKQHDHLPHSTFNSFNKAVDEFFGSVESQRADVKIIQQEKSAYKKLDNIKKDHEQRLATLGKEQDLDIHKASLIELNLQTVDQAIRVVRTAIANQIDWIEIWNLIKDAQVAGDPVALTISKLKLESNEITMALYDECEEGSDEDSDEDVQNRGKKKRQKPLKIDIDLGLTAYSNAKKYYDKKKQAAHKQQKTIDASEKALKSAEKKTMQTLKEAATIHTIQKARKTFWFEKFIWFISSENYLVLGGRDAQQNEIIVKKYLSAGDVYVHADLHGATSCIIKNSQGSDIPPKTLNEAGTMAICHSAAWNAKVVTSAWWVHHHQVSKTAPSGEYLSTGSFLIRGKKNYLPPSYLIYGFGILFKVDETCIWKHKNERKVCSVEDDQASNTTESLTNSVESELKIEDSESDDSSEENEKTGAETEPADETEQSVSNEVEFPETNVKLEYDSIKTNEEENDDYIVYLGDDEAVSVQNKSSKKEDRRPHMSAKQRREKKKNNSAGREAEDGPVDLPMADDVKEDVRPGAPTSSSQEDPQVQLKRGHKNKIKKIKNKYKDQDEEERLLKMELLQESQSQKARDRKAKKNKSQNKAEQKRANKRERNPGKLAGSHSHTASTKKSEVAKEPTDGNDSEEERERILQNEHLNEESANILNSLTGCPMTDDILLFALPVCAPYNTMQNYKYKVKLTPGNTKKGKGAKSAIALFQNLHETTPLEKDHLRSIKDNDLSQNIPGKVKISAPNLKAIRKKK